MDELEVAHVGEAIQYRTLDRRRAPQSVEAAGTAAPANAPGV
jgi:hypothetical protein